MTTKVNKLEKELKKKRFLGKLVNNFQKKKKRLLKHV